MGKLKFKIQLSTTDLYYFMMYHYYTKLSGIFGIILSLAAAVLLCVRHASMGYTEKLFFFIVAIAFTILNPVLMWVKANTQIHKNKSLGGELTYFLDDTQISIRMGSEKADIKWEQVTTVRDNGRELVVYVTHARGYIWPKTQIQAEYEQIITTLKKCVDARRLKLKK